MDGFDQDEAESERDERAVILRRLLASKCDTLEAFELADRLFDACPCLVPWSAGGVADQFLKSCSGQAACCYGQSYCERHQGQQPKGRTQRPDIWAHRSRMGLAKKESILDRGVVPHMGIPLPYTWPNPSTRPSRRIGRSRTARRFYTELVKALVLKEAMEDLSKASFV